MVKKPSFGRGSHKISSNSYFLNNSSDSNKNSSNNNINTIDINSKNQEKQKGPKRNTKVKKSFRKMKTTKFVLGNNEEKKEQNFRIIKEVIDPKKYIVVEEELFRQGEGYCFGEWALIYREPRAASIYTLEDCIFFTLDEVHFRNSFLKSLNNSEYNKKKFALQNFLPFNMIDERQLSIYKNIIPITCKRNQVIFQEGDISDSIYLIYLGSFTLEKKYGIKQYRVLDLERGSIVGLESIFEGEKSKYKCTLKLSPGLDVGLIFQMKINRLRPYVVNQMKISFKTNYNVFIKSWNYLFLKNVMIHQKISNEKNMEEQKKEFDKIIEENKELMELNSSLSNKKLDSVLSPAYEDKYEKLFKTCLQKKTYKNVKKDGTLRIFSCRQRNKIKEPNFINEDKNCINSKSLNIIKYFQNIRSDIKENNSKTSNSFLKKNYSNLNINDNSESNFNTLKSFKDKINLTENKNNIVLKKDKEDSNNKFLFNKQIFINDKKKKQKNNLKTNSLKLSKNLLVYETNSFKDNIQNDSKVSKESKYKTIHFKNNSVLNEKNNFPQKDLAFLKKITKDIEIKDNIKNEINTKIKRPNKLIININKNLNYNKGKNSESMNFSNDIIINSRNKSLLLTKKNCSFEKNIFNNISKIISPISNRRKKFDSFHSPKNITNNLFNNLFFSESSSKINDKENSKIIFSNSKYSTIEPRHFSPVNIKTKNILKSFNQNNNLFINEKIKMKNELKNKNINYRNKKIQNCVDIEDDKNIFHELSLSTGFPVTYFKKINPISSKNILSPKYKPFPSPTNLFKVSLDSGIFEIPLISSSLK